MTAIGDALKRAGITTATDLTRSDDADIPVEFSALIAHLSAIEADTLALIAAIKAGGRAYQAGDNLANWQARGEADRLFTQIIARLEAISEQAP